MTMMFPREKRVEGVLLSSLATAWKIDGARIGANSDIARAGWLGGALFSASAGLSGQAKASVGQHLNLVLGCWGGLLLIGVFAQGCGICNQCAQLNHS